MKKIEPCREFLNILNIVLDRYLDLVNTLNKHQSNIENNVYLREDL
jgi:hypothetical protein